MPFTWINPTNAGNYAESEQFQEIRTKVNTLATNILLPTPPSSYTISFVQPLADDLTIQDEVVDEVQANLDILKSENYCRGHYNARHISNNANDRVTFHSAKCSDLQTDTNTSNNSGYLASQHAGKYLTNYTNQNSTRNVTYHRDYDSGYD